MKNDIIGRGGEERRSRPGPQRGYWVMVAMLVLCALTGGASRADSLAQGVVRGGMGVLLAIMVLIARPAEWRSLRLPLIFLAVLAIILAAMLMPLPPSIWTALPGRALIAQLGPIAGIGQPWRPFAIAPPLGTNALFALVPPAAALIGLVFLTPQDRVRLIVPVAILIVASAVLGVAQVSGGADSALRWYAATNSEAGVGFFANRNHQAILLAMGFPVLATWATGAGGQGPSLELRRWLAGGAAVLLSISLLTTGSRAGLVAGAIALLVTMVIHARAIRSIPATMRRWAIGGTIGAIAVLGAIGSQSPQARSIVRLMTLDMATDSRAETVPTLLTLLRTYFPAGTGFGGFEPAFRSAEPLSLLGLFYVNEAHNEYLQVAIEGGVLGIGLLAAFVLWWGAKTVSLFRASGPGYAGPIAQTGALLILLLLAASAVDYPVRTPLMMVLLVVASAWMTLPKSSHSA